MSIQQMDNTLEEIDLECWASLRQPTFNQVLDKYLNEGCMGSDEYECLTTEQKLVIQCLKRSFKRLNK